MLSVTFVSTATSNSASYRYRVQTPVLYLKRKGMKTAVDRKAKPSDNVLVFSKHWMYSDWQYAMFCQARGQKIIFDMCDDHFGDKVGGHYLRMTSLADVITCNSKEMAKSIRRNTGKDAVVIDDPVLSKAAARPKSDNPSMLWYGMAMNVDGLYEAYPEGCEVPLEVIYPCRMEPPEKLTKPWVKYTQWEGPQTVEQAAARNEIAFLPYRQGKAAKSANRVLEAINMGLYVMTDPLPACKGLPVHYINDGLDKGIQEYKELTAQSLEERKEALAPYTPEVVSDAWAEAIREAHAKA